MSTSADLLVMYDGSPSGDESIRLACAFAKSEGRRVEVMAVAIVPPALPLVGLPVSFAERKRLQLAYACELVQLWGVTIDTRVVHAYETLQGVLNECDRIRPVALFLGTDSSPGRWFPRRLPTFVRQVMRHAPCPVYIAHAPHSRVPSATHVLAEAERVLQSQH